MRWGKRKRSSQHLLYVGVESRPRLRDRVLFRTLVFLVGLFLVLGVATTGWGVAVYAVPALQTGTVAIVGSSGGHMYAAPGGDIVAELDPATVVTAVGRADNNLWVVVRNNEGLSGWLEARELTIFGLEQLPIMLTTTTDPSTDAPSIIVTPNATSVAQAPAPIPTATPPLAAPAVPASTSPLGIQPTLVAVVRTENAELYDRPDGTLAERLIPGTAIAARGRTEDGLWVAVTIPGGNSGWSQSADLIISNLAEVPVVDPVTGLAVPTPVAETPSSGVVAGTDSSSDPVAPSLPPTATGPTRMTATVNVGNSRLNIRSGPSTDFQILGKANQADILDVVGRNTAATWVQVVTPGVGSGVSWVSADYVSLSQPILGIADVETVGQPIVVSPPVVSPQSIPTRARNRRHPCQSEPDWRHQLYNRSDCQMG